MWLLINNKRENLRKLVESAVERMGIYEFIVSQKFVLKYWGFQTNAYTRLL